MTATAPDVVVYVNDEGVPQYTSTVGKAIPTHHYYGSSASTSASSVATSSAASSSSSTEAAAPASTSSSSTTEAESTTAALIPTAAAVDDAVVHSSSTSSSDAASSSSASSAGYGISYTPYNSDGTCKTQADVTQDFESIAEYSIVRIYGTDCNQVSTVLTAAAAKDIMLFAGVYDITEVTSEIQTIISAANGDWSNIDTISIGNEGVNDGTYTVDAVVAAIGTARTLLSAAGYTGNVVTVDTFVAIIANPALCLASDYAAANCHAFFDSTTTAENAGAYVLSMAEAVSLACGKMNTVITESGWPWQGDANGDAVPSVANQATALASLKSTFSSNIILFTAYNDYWKTNNAGTFDAEQYWGFLGDSPSG